MKHLWQARTSQKHVAIGDDTYFDQDSGLVTLQYPKQQLPVPDTGRYKLHNEIDDCIVCDKCAKVCPVNCIDIEPIKATEEIGKTSDGTSKRLYAAKFDIDMGKCCFCGLCTTVCPTECLTMTSDYDFSVFDVKEHNFSFANLSLEEIINKKAQAAEAASAKSAIKSAPAPAAKPVFKPKVVAKPQSEASTNTPLTPEESPKPKPVFRPKVVVKKTEASKTENSSESEKPKVTSKPKVVIKPKVKSETPPAEDKPSDADEKPITPKARPVIKPKVVIRKKKEGEDE
ncbi:4Fe-4S dicluster domain-containing protein [Penaeicola halotolerans]|uniref:4Fe-4S dicluster domain-containing protein n=1 Tax=Penaeicola halotolerans TaxID=2793196 RepID=UPI001CF90D80|nr:4Fe-4S dicluster domain-containing protein [Penaeicola halotolerans]